MFTFKDPEKKMKAYKSTSKNYNYIFADSVGIGVGCGPKFGLYIN